nr:uncharacterized protein LOC129263728 [Lytechinus pictus]
MALFNSIKSGDNVHWMSTSNNQENVGGGSTSPTGFDPAVGGASTVSSLSSSGSGDSSSSSSSQFGLLRNTLYQSPTGPGGTISREDQFFCKVCRVDLSGLEPAKQHYTGKQHRKAVQAQESGRSAGDGLPLPLECKICQKKFTGPSSAKQHYESSKHKTAVQGAAFWAQNQGQGGTVPSGVTGLGPVTREAGSIPASPRASQQVLLLNDSVPDGALNQRQHQAEAPRAQSNLGTSGRSLQQSGSHPPKGFASVVNPGSEQLKMHIAKVCSSILQRYLMQLIPDLTDQITDIVLEELSKATPVNSSHSDAGAMVPPRQDASAGEALQSVSTDFQSMPSLIDGLNSLDLRGAVKSAPEITNIMNNLSKGSTPNHKDVWNSLIDNKK